MATDAQPLLSPELLARLERLELVSRKIFRGRIKGDRRSPRKGQSIEFADFRPYVPGDDLRFLDWNLYARLDRLFLKMFLEEEDLHLYLVIDASRSMSFGTPSKLEYAKQLAAALGFIGLIRSDRIKVEILGAPPASQAPAFRGRASLWRLMEHLSTIEPSGETDLATGMKRFCLRNPGQGIVILLSDLLDKQGFEEALRYLAARPVDAYVIQVLSAEELDPPLVGDLLLVDSEDGDKADVTVSAPLLKRYRKTLDTFLSSARDYCVRRGMTYLLATNQVPFDSLITGYLRSRGLVR